MHIHILYINKYECRNFPCNITSVVVMCVVTVCSYIAVVVR